MLTTLSQASFWKNKKNSSQLYIRAVSLSYFENCVDLEIRSTEAGEDEMSPSVAFLAQDLSDFLDVRSVIEWLERPLCFGHSEASLSRFLRLLSLEETEQISPWSGSWRTHSDLSWKGVDLSL